MTTGTEYIEVGLAVAASNSGSFSEVQRSESRQKGIQTARSLGAIASNLDDRNEGFGAYYMLTDEIHREQHMAFCEHLGIELGTEYREFLLPTFAGWIVLERSPLASVEGEKADQLTYRITARMDG